MPEVAGHAAVLVDPFSVTSIREGFLKIITDDVYRRDLVERGFSNAKRFDNVQSPANTFQFMKRLVNADKVMRLNKTALITGITGQDGTYLSNSLWSRL